VPDLQVVPPELIAAASPLHDVAGMLDALADDRAGMEQLGEGSPSALLRSALGRFLERWGQVAWELSSDADWLAELLRRAAETYSAADRALARDLVP